MNPEHELTIFHDDIPTLGGPGWYYMIADTKSVAGLDGPYPSFVAAIADVRRKYDGRAR